MRLFKIMGLIALLNSPNLLATNDLDGLSDQGPKSSSSWFGGKNLKNLASTFIKFYLVVNQAGVVAYDKGQLTPSVVVTPAPVAVVPNTDYSHKAPFISLPDLKDMYTQSQEQTLRIQEVLECLDHVGLTVANSHKPQCKQWFGDFVSNGIYFSDQKMQEFYRDEYVNPIGNQYLDICLIWGGTLNLRKFKNPHTGGYEEVSVVKHFTDPFSYPLGSVLSVVESYQKLKVLKEMGVSHFIPEHKFVHLGSQYFRTYLPEWSWGDLWRLYVECAFGWWNDHTNLYTVIDRVDSTYKQDFAAEEYADIHWGILQNTTKTPMPARIVFEHYIGQWAAQKIAKVALCATQEWYYGLKWDKNYLAYHIGNGTTYLFEPGYSPRYTALIYAKSLQSKEPECDVNDPMNRLRKYAGFTPEIARFHDELGCKGLFGAMADNLKMYEVSDQRVLPDNDVTHLYIPDEFID